MAASREVSTNIWYYKLDCPKKDMETKFGFFKDVLETAGGGVSREERDKVMEKKPMTVVDGRTHLPGGKEAWNFDEHGFCFIRRPEYDFEEHLEQDRKRVNREFGPKVAEACRVATGAKRAFWMSHQRRSDNGTYIEGYARGAAHSDYGEEFESQFRSVLTARYGVEEEEANSCGLCVVNMWAPVERPAYKMPLALLDGSTIDLGKETIRWKNHANFDNGYGYYNDNKQVLGGNIDAAQQRALHERVPQAAQDAPALGPCYAPQHRWVYLPDMTEEEGVIFKQIDFRTNKKARATFHCAIDDKFHSDWKECPGRRSIECRVILTFDPEGQAKL